MGTDMSLSITLLDHLGSHTVESDAERDHTQQECRISNGNPIKNVTGKDSVSPLKNTVAFFSL